MVRLILAEFKKLFSNKIFMICFALFLVINTAGLYFMTSLNESYKYELTLVDKFNQELEYYLEMDKDDSSEELKYMKEAYQMASNIQSASSNNTDPVYVTAIIEEYKLDNPKSYEYAEKIIEDGFSSDDMYVTNLLYDKFSYIDEYDAFINEMQARTDSQLKFSVFSKPNTFAYNNIKKTPLDFAHLKGVEITPDFDLGVILSTTFELTDYLVLILVMLVCVTLFSLEREKGLTILINSTYKGRQHTAFAKFVVVFIVVTLSSLVFYASNLIVGECAFGLGALDRSIQSIPNFINCTIKCSVWQYLVLWLIQKSITLCATALIISFLFVLIKSTNLAYVILAIFFGCEFCFYNFINPMSRLNHFKCINMFYYLHGNELLGNYLNLDFFKNPVNIVSIYITIVILCFLVVPVICALLYSKQCIFKGANVFGGLIERLRKKINIFNGSISIFNGECYKHYISQKNIFIIILVLCCAFFSFNENISIVYSNGAEVAYSAYLNQLEGELTSEKEEFIEEELEYFDDLNANKAEIESDENLTEDEKNAQLTAINNILDTRGKGFEKVLSQYETIKSTGDKLDIIPCFINYTIASKLMMDSDRELSSFLMFMIFTVFAFSGIFAYEHKNGMCTLICSAKNGKGRLVVAKFSVVFLSYFIMFTLIYLPYMLNFIRTFGSDILFNSLAFLDSFAELESEITILQAILLESFVHITIGFAVTMFILFLSNKLKSTITTMIISTSVTLIPCLLIYFNKELRFFSLFINNKLWVVILIIILSMIISIFFALLTYKSFAGNTIRRQSNGA